MAVLKPSYTSFFKERRNHLTSLWNVLFENCQEWMSFKPSLGLCVYPCYACRHMFSSKNSLQDHVNRRILVLKYNCPGCPNEVLTFYNRCSFLLHARDHHDLEQGQINLQEVDIFPLPVQLAGFLPDTSIPLLYAEEEESATDININSKFYSADIDQKGQPTIVLTSDDLILKQNSTTLALKQICKNIPKCELVPVAERPEVPRTNGHENTDNAMDHPMCIKGESDGYTNEITMPVISKIESLQEKLFRLPHCLECNSYQFRTMAEHYQGANKPNDMALSCTVCKFVASTKCSLLAHIRIHDDTPPYVCPDCGKYFGASEPLTQHINAVCFHSAKIVRFKCPGKKCGKLFATNATFTNHFKMHMNCVLTCALCSNTFSTIEDVKDHLKAHEESYSFSRTYKCLVCSDLGPLSESAYTKHLENHTNDTNTFVYVYVCRGCRSYFRSTTTYASHLLKCSDKSKVPLGKRYYCILCNKQIEIEDKLTHLRNCKYAEPVVLLENIEASAISKFVDGHSQFNTSPKVDENIKKKRKRFYPAKSNKNRRIDKDIETELIAEEPTLFDGIYNCKLCTYEHEKRSIFHDHIKLHRNISTAYQCMECGECFVVKPSLIKHLMHFHNISDYHSYLMENDSYGATESEEAEITSSISWQAKETVKENQCKICLQEFEDALLLNNHFRIHGMAYLMNNK